MLSSSVPEVRPAPSAARQRPYSVGAAYPLLLVAVLHGCSDEPTPVTGTEEDTPVARIDVTPGTLELLFLGATHGFRATAETSAGQSLPETVFLWTSSASNVASVAPDGTVTARAAGTATISASAEGVSGQAQVTVRQRVERVVVTPGSPVLVGLGASLNVESEAFDLGGAPLPPTTPTWASTNVDVASVAAVGLETASVTALRDGQAAISATVDGVTGYGMVTVVRPEGGPERTWIDGGTSPQTLNAVWGSAADDVWAVGGSGMIRHFDGVGWVDASPGLTTQGLTDVWGTGPEDVWAIGPGVVLHYDGSSWSEPVTPTIPTGIRALWGSSPQEVWAVCTICAPYFFDGADWNPTAPEVRLTGISGVGPDAVWASGYQGSVAFYDGSSWVSEAIAPITVDFLGVWALSDQWVWAVGTRGSVQRFDGSAWEDLSDPLMGTTTHLQAVWASGPNDVHVVGSNSVFHYDGSQWTESTPVSLGDRLFDVWGTADGDVWAVGQGFLVRGVVGPVAELTGVELASTTVTLGSSVSYEATVTNLVGGTVYAVLLQATVEQGTAERAAGGTAVNCGTPLEAGNLPPGSCTFAFTLGASNSGAGTGTLVAGPATARFDLLLESEVLVTLRIPITLSE